MELPQRGSATLSGALYTTLRGWIQTGTLTPGAALPSSRRLAGELSIGRNTVLTALERLVAEGFVISRPGAGLFVARLALPAFESPGPMDTAEGALSARGSALLAHCAVLNTSHHAFAPGVPALDLFPREQWQRLLRRHQQRAPEQWLAYRMEGGVQALKEALCDYLRLSRSVRCTPQQILITQGAQQGFELIARLLADPGDSAWIEEPGYGGAQAAFRAAGLALVPVPVDDEGMDPARVPSDAKPPALIYVTPSHQYPRGVTLSLARRLALLESAERHDAWLIEDDYDSEFRYATPPLASLQGLSERTRVIYVGTFSKVLYPGLRLGYLVLPPSLIEPFRRANARLNREGQYVTQAALADFIERGYFARHIARMRRVYQHRQTVLRQVLAPATAEGLSLSAGHAGMHLLASLESASLERTLVEAGNEAGTVLSPLSKYFVGNKPEPGLVLGYAGSNEERITRAGGWLVRAWQTLRTGT
ncbi:PLP-dependent aminotransferase family protein [Kushneria phosphatilytica]|uniref:PLP-dependent aminotransferase family protein n=1 Tax=Kushneria phosphatilytica TaxID=657387 RepID=A0A1S1NNS1_9GAMM|nr:PLP-dependent aminotransferase family protein [Kushneria phosphatilytica]OHV08977.1 GntR family transcriptional regulator [Kushneria phosphatilytica]QEL12903.1 PLP-dependent aminotransferase family protein [Kushneria phosphatilytica]